MSMILMVLHDPDRIQEVLAAWEEAGISGATVLYSTGLGSIRIDEGLRDDIPLIPSVSDFYSHPEHLSRTIFTIAADESIIPRVVAATEAVLGDLSEPGKGILVILPTALIKGLRKR